MDSVAVVVVHHEDEVDLLVAVAHEEASAEAAVVEAVSQEVDVEEVVLAAVDEAATKPGKSRDFTITLEKNRAGRSSSHSISPELHLPTDTMIIRRRLGAGLGFL